MTRGDLSTSGIKQLLQIHPPCPSYRKDPAAATSGINSYYLPKSLIVRSRHSGSGWTGELRPHSSSSLYSVTILQHTVARPRKPGDRPEVTRSSKPSTSGASLKRGAWITFGTMYHRLSRTVLLPTPRNRMYHRHALPNWSNLLASLGACHWTPLAPFR